jgi:hypothetical protein
VKKSPSAPKGISVQRIYRPNSVSVAHIDVTDRAQAELWQWWIWAAGSDKYPDGLSLADKLPLHRALRDRTAVLSAAKRPGHIILTARLP